MASILAKIKARAAGMPSATGFEASEPEATGAAHSSEPSGPPVSRSSAWRDAPALRPAAVGPGTATDALGFVRGLAGRNPQPSLPAASPLASLGSTAAAPIASLTPVTSTPAASGSAVPNGPARPPLPAARSVQRVATALDAGPASGAPASGADPSGSPYGEIAPSGAGLAASPPAPPSAVHVTRSATSPGALPAGAGHDTSTAITADQLAQQALAASDAPSSPATTSTGAASPLPVSRAGALTTPGAHPPTVITSAHAPAPAPAALSGSRGGTPASPLATPDGQPAAGLPVTRQAAGPEAGTLHGADGLPLPHSNESAEDDVASPSKPVDPDPVSVSRAATATDPARSTAAASGPAASSPQSSSRVPPIGLPVTVHPVRSADAPDGSGSAASSSPLGVSSPLEVARAPESSGGPSPTGAPGSPVLGRPYHSDGPVVQAAPARPTTRSPVQRVSTPRPSPTHLLGTPYRPTASPDQASPLAGGDGTPSAPGTVVDRAPSAAAAADAATRASTMAAMPISRAVAAPDVDPAPAPTEAPAPASGPGAAAAGSQELPPDLADQIYTKIERRLRMELLLDRERRSTLSNAFGSPR